MLADLRENRDDIRSVMHMMGLERAIRMSQWLRKNAPEVDISVFWEWTELHFHYELDKLNVGRAQIAVDNSRKRRLQLLPAV
jgi:hypothetical protein